MLKFGEARASIVGPHVAGCGCLACLIDRARKIRNQLDSSYLSLAEWHTLKQQLERIEAEIDRLS